MFQVKFSTMCLLLVLQGAAVMVLYNWYFQVQNSPSEPSNRQVHVLLLSSWRSGSSFLGDVFNQHPSVFYLMEPAWHTWVGLKNNGAGVLRMAVRDLLSRVFHCDLSVMEAYRPSNHKLPALYMWTSSRALCSPPICPSMPPQQASNPKLCSQICRTRLLSEAEEACRNYNHVVLKEVRLFELESLYPLFQDPSLDLRIIHLVRDPRAVALSRDIVASDLIPGTDILLNHENYTNSLRRKIALRKICNSHVVINKAGLQNPPPFLKGRYKLIRFEDIVNNPLEEIKLLFDFVGLEMTEQLGDWIFSLTNANNSKTGGFTIESRNAKEISVKWRGKMTYEDVKSLQDECKQAMSLFGYRNVNSEKELTDYEQDLLLPLMLQQVDQEEEKNLSKNPNERPNNSTKIEATNNNTI